MATTGDKSTRNIPEYRQIKPHTHMCIYVHIRAFERGYRLVTPRPKSFPFGRFMPPLPATARALCRQEIFVPYPSSLELSFLPLSLAPSRLSFSAFGPPSHRLSFSTLFFAEQNIPLSLVFPLSLSFSFAPSLSSHDLSCLLLSPTFCLFRPSIDSRPNPPVDHRYSFLYTFYIFPVYLCSFLSRSHSVPAYLRIFSAPVEHGENCVRD